MAQEVKVLVLGGTAEARTLAALLVDGPARIVSSLAGRVSRPALPVGEVRVGGFGGAAGLASYLETESITAIVDATHPFAATISANAAAAAARTGLPLLAVRRPGWHERPGDDWRRVPDIAAAATAAAAAGDGTIFLTTGRRDLAAFAADSTHDYLVRTVDPPIGRTPPRMTLLLDRGPYRLAGERELMSTHGVRLLVTKDSGGPLTAAKLDAARELGVPCVVVDRPVLPNGVRTVTNVEDAAAWVASLS